MTERSLYAHAATVLLTACLLAGRAEAQGPACGACIGVTTSPGQTVLLPDELGGMTILVREQDAPVETLRAALDDVRRRGGRAALLVVPPQASSVPAEQAYRLKLRLTELRGAFNVGTTIALDLSGVPPGTVQELAGYVDVLIGDAPNPRPGSSPRTSWQLLPTTDVAAALEATRRGGTEVWVMRAPDDVVDAQHLLEKLARAATAPAEGYSEDVEVRAARRLTVDEIIARHQAFARRQSARVTHTIASGTMTLTFEAPGFPAPVTIESDTFIYIAPDRTELEQRSIRVNGIEFRGTGVPRLPIIEPERVVSPPLAITLSDLYRYQLDGEEIRDGVRCYVVSFTPVDRNASLFSGRAWIAVQSFAMVRAAATQTRLRGAIVASEQVDDFREVSPGIWLLQQSDVRQIYEGPGHRTPIHRRLVIAAQEVNPPNFAARLQTAYASRSVMLRDTAAGYRYLKRDQPKSSGDAPPLDIVPELAARAASVRTLAAGVIIDPNISVPLPFAGLSYVNFDLFGTGTQLNAFFGGSYLQAAFSTPSVGGSRWQLAGRAFGIATSYNDRSFRGGTEIYEENIRQRPAHVSVWVLRPLTPRVSLRLGYELDYTRLEAASETSPEFAVPADQLLHGARIAIDVQRAGWAGSLWWNPARRSGWEPWGHPGDYDPAHQALQRYGVSLARSMPLIGRAVVRGEGVVMGGTGLDRFSRYSFGTFDNRLRGYPSALIRYDRGAVLRGAVAWPITTFARLDGFVDTAYVRDRGFGTGYRNYTGVGAALELPAPFGLLTSVEWGYGFRGVDAGGGRGTHVIRVSAFKVF